MQNSPYSEKIYELIKKEYPLLYDEQNSIIYLDHAGASLYSKSQIKGFHEELEQNLLCNPHTNFGKLKVIFIVACKFCPRFLITYILIF